MEDTDFFILSSGVKIPKIGLGTWRIYDKDVLYSAIVELGYRHIDTGSFYKNEEVIGEVLTKIFEETDIKREDLFITTKIWGDQKHEVEGALNESLRKLKIDYVDLYLSHFPVAYKKVKVEGSDEEKFELAKIPNYKTWQDLESCVKKGLTKHIGTSNYNVQSLQDLMSYAEIMPVVNEVELHPYLTQESLVKFCKKYDILPLGYCPLARAGNKDEFGPEGIYENEVIKEICEKYQKTPAQICLNWGVSRGYPVIPKSSNLERLKQNLDSTSFKMSEDDFQKISDLNCNYRIVYGERLFWCCYDDIFA